MANPFDQFDSNPYDSFDTPTKETPKPSVMEQVGMAVKGSVPGRIMRKSMDIADQIPYEVGGAVTDIHSKLPVTRAIAPELGFGANVATQFIMGGGMMPSSAPAKVPLKDLVKMDTLNKAREIGLNVPPSAAGAGHVEKAIESIGGKADIAREMSSRNREAIQIAARKEAGIPENLPITEDTLNAAREVISEPYRQIAAISPKAEKALESLKSARQQAKVFWKHYNVSADPKSLAQAEKFDLKAEGLEAKISLLAGENAPDLMPALKEARIALAKNYDIEKALNVGTGEVDARMIGRMVDKRGTKAITGSLQTIGKFAQAYPDFVQPKAVATDVSALRPYVALGAGLGGYGASEHYSGTPYGIALGMLPFLSPGARGLALSKAMQSGALGPGASAGRAGAASLIPLSEVGKD